MQRSGPLAPVRLGRPATLLLTLLAAPLAAASATPAAAQDRPVSVTSEPLPTDTAVAQTRSAAVVVQGDTIIVLTRSLGPYSPVERAAAIRDRIRELARTRGVATDSVAVVETAVGSNIEIGGRVVATLTDEDAAAMGVTRSELAADVAERMGSAMQSETWMSLLEIIGVGVGFSLLALAGFYLIFRLMNGVFPRLYTLLESWRGTRIPALRIQKLEIVSSSRITDVLLVLSKALYWLTLAALLYFVVPLVLSFFPWTQDLADRLLDYVIQPFRRSFRAIADYIPDLFGLAVLFVITRYLLVLIHFVFHGIERGAITIRGFHDEWAEPTYKIVRFMVLVFALILALPLLPGAGTDAFSGVSVFVGLLVSLGSAGAIANVIAGIVITYMRPFRLGDRVKIADTVGDVVEKSLLVTRVRTIKNVAITIPNAMVLGAHIINYSSSATDRGVIMHTTVTIGYDVPWRTVHELLIGAAEDTPAILDEPEPFVLQTALGDYAVSYELNAFTDVPGVMAQIYSDLHQHIQDRFSAAGIEIMSPAYSAVRDGNRIAIPDEALPKDYEAPTFRLRNILNPEG